MIKKLSDLALQRNYFEGGERAVKEQRKNNNNNNNE